jgi:hypothetical protein
VFSTTLQDVVVVGRGATVPVTEGHKTADLRDAKALLDQL